MLCGVLDEKSLIFFFEDLVLEDEGVGEPECVLFLEDHLERPGVVFFLEVADWRGSVKLRRARHFNNKIYNPLKRLNKARFDYKHYYHSDTVNHLIESLLELH